MVRKTEHVDLSHYSPLNIMSYSIFTDSLLDSRLVDPGSTLIYVGAYGPYNIIIIKILLEIRIIDSA